MMNARMQLNQIHDILYKLRNDVNETYVVCTGCLSKLPTVNVKQSEIIE